MNDCLEIDPIGLIASRARGRQACRSRRIVMCLGRPRRDRAPMSASAPLGTRAQQEKPTQESPRVVAFGPAVEIIVEKSEPLSARQKPPDGSIEMYQVE